MTRNGIGPEAQDNIVQGISSFAMYGFPESHAASFALIAYASAYLKVHYLAAFTCGLLNNQPMGFYSPAVLIKDAQRHGLRVRPICVQHSTWPCTLEPTESGLYTLELSESGLCAHERSESEGGGGFNPRIMPTKSSRALAPEENCFVSGHDFSRAEQPPIETRALAPEEAATPTLRVGLLYIKGLRQSSAEAIVAARTLHGPFTSVDDLTRRVPQLNRKELVVLASAGALNSIDQVAHRRDALWQVEQAGRPVGPLLRNARPDTHSSSPLKQMTTDERLAADFAGTGITTGPHPMAYQRESLRRQRILSAAELERQPNNASVRIAGRIICRQRPGTAKGFVFLSLEDETGIANIILTPDVFEQNRILATRSRYLLIAGLLQNQDGVVHVKARSLAPFNGANDRAQESSTETTNYMHC